MAVKTSDTTETTGTRTGVQTQDREGTKTMPGYDLQGEEPGVQPRVSTQAKRWSSDDPVITKENLNWRNGIFTIAAAHGMDLTERARETLRRALGELYQEMQGAEPASETAHKVAENLGDADFLNKVGDEQHQAEHDAFNQHGQSLYGG